MNAPHLHLILNHVPTIGTAIALGLLLLSLIRKNEELTRVSLELFCVITLVTLPAYLSGVATMLAIENLPDVSKAVMSRHHDGALLAYAFLLLTGGSSWFGLWQFRRVSHPSRMNVMIVVLLAIASLTLMAATATMGGEVRHPEMMVEGTPSSVDSPAWITAASVAALVTDHTWVWPAAEALHFIGLWLLFGIVLLVNLRMLGMMKAAPFSALHRLLPWAVLGLGINLVTGMMWVIATPEMYSTNVSFFWKMGFLMLAGANLIYVTTFDEPWSVGAGEDAPFMSKAMAASAIALWVGVMYFGRMLPFLGNSF
ncbi:MAG TPA: hypothetical protein VI485_28475 [Vicinamibacterales bacterium]|nr:hypothetical protein [Vicinamibacterales bacterium]